MVTGHELALARGRAYALLGDLFHRGLTPALLAQVASVDEFRAALPATYDPDEASAAHHSVFGLNVFPYQSVFLGPGALLGGAERTRVAISYAASGYLADAADGEPDHIAAELAFLAALCATEADAHAGGRTRTAEQAARSMRAFLDEHLLWWLPIFVQAVRRQGDPFYAAVADMTLALGMDHRLALGADDAHATSPGRTRLPASADPLAEPAAGLKDLADFLATPVQAGLFLSREDIGRIARGCGLPCGFGDRRQMLTTLLRAAAEFDGLPALAAALRGVAQEHVAAYDRYAAGGVPFAVAALDWRGRAEHLLRVIDVVTAGAAVH